MDNTEKLQLINSLKVIDVYSSGENIESVLVESNKSTGRLLNKIGMTDKEIKSKCFPNEGVLDLVKVGFEYANCFSIDKGFYNK